jgi:acyl carrier protein
MQPARHAPRKRGSPRTPVRARRRSTHGRFSDTRAVHMGTDISSEVKRIIKEQLDVDEKDIKPESSFIDDLGADSLGLVELVLAFEEAFEIDIPDEDTEKIRTVQDAIEYIERHAKK